MYNIAICIVDNFNTDNLHLIFLQRSSNEETTAGVTTEEVTTAVPTATTGMYTFTYHKFLA